MTSVGGCDEVDGCPFNGTFVNTNVSFNMFTRSERSASRGGFAITTAMFGVLFITSSLWLVKRVRERENSAETLPVPLVPGILRAFKNHAFRPLLIGCTILSDLWGPPPTIVYQ